jgi:hypothetical protein
VDKRSASTSSLADGTRSAAATQIWNCCHGLGYEKIAVTSLLVTPPKFITEDQSNVLVFRFNGLKPMVGYRVRNIFYVLWFDHNFSVYPHG